MGTMSIEQFRRKNSSDISKIRVDSHAINAANIIENVAREL